MMLVKPKRIRNSTDIVMHKIVEYLYFMRIATLSQLSRLVGLSEPDLRLKLKRYDHYIDKRHSSATLYDIETQSWQRVSRVNIYTLPRHTVNAFELDNDINFYRKNYDRNPTPSREQWNDLILINEIWLRMLSIQGNNLELLPKIAFDTILNEHRGVSVSSYSLPVLCGLRCTETETLYSVNLFSGLPQQFTRAFKRLAASTADLIQYFRPVVFTTKGSGEIIKRCNRSNGKPMVDDENRHLIGPLNAFGSFAVYDYEWCIANPLALNDALQGNRDAIINSVYSHHPVPLGCHLRKKPNGIGSYNNTYNWIIEDSDGNVMEYVDTTIGQTAGNIHSLATATFPPTEEIKGICRTVWVATEEEKRTWERTSADNSLWINYRVIDWRLNGAVVPSIQVDNEFDELLEEWERNNLRP